MSNYHHYTTRARSHHTWEPEEPVERTETSTTSNWRRRSGGGNQQTNSYRGDRNDRTSGYSEFQPLRNRREALPDQSTSWRSSSTTTQGQGGWGTRRNNFDNRGGGEESSIWSTGEYKPISSSCRRGSKSPSPPPYSQSGWTTPERRQKLHQRSTPLPIPSPAYLEAASSSTSPSTNDEPPILVLDLNHTLLCRSERNRAGSKIPLVRPYLSTFLEYISSPSSTSSSTDSQRVQRFLPIIFSSARYRNVLSLLSALNLVPSEKLPPPYDPRQPPLPPSPEVKGPYSEVYVCNREEEGDVLRLVWTRENMGLSDRDFRGDVETCKNLEGVWKALKLGQSPSSSQSIEGVEQVEEVGEVETEKKRNLEGAKRTILLDDEISKAAQQPYSLLPIKPFILTRKDFPILPSFQQKYPNEPPPPPFALELPHSDHPAWQDKSLLKVVFELDWIREEWSSKGKNIAYEIKNGGFEKMREEVEKELEEERGGEVIGQKEIEEEMEKRGEEICRKAGIQVRREWDKGWRERVLEKFR